MRKLKSLTAFNIACGIAVCVFMSLHRVLSIEFDRVARGPAMLAIGMLLSQVPKVKIRLSGSGQGEKLTLLVNALGFAVSFAAFVYLAYLPKYEIWKLHLLGCLVSPAVLYFATALPVRSKLLNFLGECSVFIYLAQCPVLLHHFYVSRDTRDQFPLLCICAVALFLLNRVINRYKLTDRFIAVTHK